MPIQRRLLLLLLDISISSINVVYDCNKIIFAFISSSIIELMIHEMCCHCMDNISFQRGNCGTIHFQEQAFDQMILADDKKELIRAVARNGGYAPIRAWITSMGGCLRHAKCNAVFLCAS